VLAALPAPALAGRTTIAGGGYATGVKQAGGQISSSLQALVKALGISLHYPVSPTAGRQCAAVLTSAEGRLAAAQMQLSALQPPASAKAANAQLLAGTVALERQLRPLIAQLGNGYLVAAAKLLRLPSVRTIQTAAKRLRAAGYPTGI
jgi:hypothetical protein